MTFLSKLKKGDLFRLKNGKKTFQYNGKERVEFWNNKKGKFRFEWAFSYSDVEDIGDFRYSKKDKEVLLHFEY